MTTTTDDEYFDDYMKGTPDEFSINNYKYLSDPAKTKEIFENPKDRMDYVSPTVLYENSPNIIEKNVDNSFNKLVTDSNQTITPLDSSNSILENRNNVDGIAKLKNNLLSIQDDIIPNLRSKITDLIKNYDELKEKYNSETLNLRELNDKYILNINDLIRSAAIDENDIKEFTNDNISIDDKVANLLNLVKENKNELNRVNNLVNTFKNDKTTTESNLNKTIDELIKTSDSIIQELNNISRLEFPQKDIPLVPQANPVKYQDLKRPVRIDVSPSPPSSESSANSENTTLASESSENNTTGGKQKKRNKTPKSKKRNKKTRSKKNKRTRKHRN